MVLTRILLLGSAGFATGVSTNLATLYVPTIFNLDALREDEQGKSCFSSRFRTLSIRIEKCICCFECSAKAKVCMIQRSKGGSFTPCRSKKHGRSLGKGKQSIRSTVNWVYLLTASFSSSVMLNSPVCRSRTPMRSLNGPSSRSFFSSSQISRKGLRYCSSKL